MKERLLSRPCKRGHVGMRSTTTGKCLECKRLYHQKNMDHQKEYMREYWRSYYAKNADALKSKRRGKSVPPEKRIEYRKRWIENNRHKINAAAQEHRARKIKATPPWLSKAHRDEINRIHKRCRDISKSTGIPHHVDHIVPLGGKLVCGLHVPWNLQVITATENVRKNNRHDT